MVSSLNLTGLTIGPDGRVSFSGLASGIDFKKAVDQIIAAKQVPVDRLQQRVDDNSAKIAALKDLRTLLSTLKERIAKLQGVVSVDNSRDVFTAKQTFASTSRLDGQAPNSAANLIGVSVSNAAAPGSHTLEVRRIATAHKLGSATFSSQTAALGFAGSFDLTGSGGTATIPVQATDSLKDIRDRINNANTGASATGVSASIVQVSGTQFVLTLTDKKTGETITFANEAGGVLGAAGLGIFDTGSGTYLNELQTAQTARFTADGLLDPDRYESDFIAASTDKLSSIAASATYPGSFQITVGASSVTVNYTSANTVQDLVTSINNAITAAGAGNAVFDAGTSASLVADGSGVRLVITDTSGAAITLTDSNGLLNGLGMDNDLVIERSSNTITDLFTGVTLTLFQAEEGTTIKLDIENNLADVKTAITDFVAAYNAVRSFVNGQNLTDPTTGEKSKDAGVLFGSRTLASITSRLAQIVGAPVGGTSSAFSVLAQIGITFVDNSTLDDPTLADTLVVDETVLDEALLNNFADVRRLLAFDFSSSDSRVSLLSFTGKTSYSTGGYTLNIGNVGPSQESSVAITDKTAALSNAASSFGATTAGTFTINGTPISYDADGLGGNDDTLETLRDAINNAAITGVSATIVQTGSTYQLRITSTTDPLAIAGDTGDLVAKLGLTVDSYLAGSANIDGAANGADDGTATTSGRIITVTDQSGAEGLKVFYNGTSDVSGVTLNFTVGAAVDMFFALDDMLSETTGIVSTDIASLEDQKEVANDRIQSMLDRLAIQRQVLTDKFIALETALAKAQTLRDNLQQTFDAWFASQKS